VVATERVEQKSYSSDCCPILAWSAFTSIGGSRRSLSPRNASAARRAAGAIR
jgi:hypothetical protein